MSTACTLQDLVQLPCTECVTNYRPGGFHPVHLNDTFKGGRYEVVHKLGYGAYGTVWLVYDTILKRYASLKVLAAEVSDSHSETAVIQHLQQHATGSGKGYVVEVFESFKHSGPNGTHQCIVMEVLGPPITPDIKMFYQHRKFPIKVAKQISTQVARGLAYIHKAGIVHGDLHMANVLLYSPTIASWSSLSEFEKYLGVPARGLLRLRETNELAPPSLHIPSYVVHTAHPNSLIRLCLLDSTQVHVKICDFGEAFVPALKPNPQGPLNTPVLYAAPEVIFGDPTGQPADIWALAVLIHGVFSRSNLFPVPEYSFSPSYDTLRKEVIKQMVLIFGKLPEKWWSKWEERNEWFNEDGEWTSPKRKRIVEWTDDDDDEDWLGDSNKGFRKKLIVSRGCQLCGTEVGAFDEMIRRMVRYDPEERASIGEVLEWMNQFAA